MPVCNTNLLYVGGRKEFCQNGHGNAMGWDNLHPRAAIGAVLNRVELCEYCINRTS